MTPILFFIACLFSGTLLPVPEDATLLAAGVSVVDLPSFFGLWLAGVAGLFLRDGGFFLTGRILGEGLFRMPLMVRLFGKQRIQSARDRIESWGSKAILGARMAFGMRSVAFLASGALGVPLRTFALWDLLALVAWVPVALVMGALVREPVLAAVSWMQEHPILMVSMVAIIALGWMTSEMVRRTEQDLHANGA